MHIRIGMVVVIGRVWLWAWLLLLLFLIKRAIINNHITVVIPITMGITVQTHIMGDITEDIRITEDIIHTVATRFTVHGFAATTIIMVIGCHANEFAGVSWLLELRK